MKRSLNQLHSDSSVAVGFFIFSTRKKTCINFREMVGGPKTFHGWA